jgi:methylated-DNA-[protein]-cysteine S-methyltransferase
VTAWTIYESPLGPLTLIGGPSGLTGIHFPGRTLALDESRSHAAPFTAVVAQLEEYFAGERKQFELPLDLAGTAVQHAVWDALQAIPFGTTTTYSELTRELGCDSTDYEQVRRIAAAIGRNPTPIVVPCHRVLAANGDLTGYLGGLQRKQALLDLEAAVAAGRPPEPAWAFRQTALL